MDMVSVSQGKLVYNAYVSNITTKQCYQMHRSRRQHHLEKTPALHFCNRANVYLGWERYGCSWYSCTVWQTLNFPNLSCSKQQSYSQRGGNVKQQFFKYKTTDITISKEIHYTREMIRQVNWHIHTEINFNG